jgi:peroxiredoxin
MRTVMLTAMFALGLSAQTTQGPQVPRKAREFSLVEPSGKTTLLSSLRGKVVVIQFLDTMCPHCQAYSLFLSKLTSDLGSKGFQAWGVAFHGDDAKTAAAYKEKFAFNFPVGYAARNTVMNFLAIPEQLMGVPQIVVIDKKGEVRAQTAPMDPENSPSPIRKEENMRKLINQLLAEKPGAGSPAVTKTTKKKES